MNTSEINDEMINVDCFIGTYSMDQLPGKIFKRPIGLIVNLDPHYKPGSHWVAIYIDENNLANYFDSYGFPIFKKEIYKFLKLNNIKEILYNKFVLQSFKSSTCGAFCILFLKLRCHGYKLNEFLNLYSNIQTNNDLTALKILN